MEIKSFKDIFRASPDDLKEIVRQQWGAKQNPKHHPEGNTLKHIIVVTTRAIRQHPDNRNLIMAAYFHDLGKMQTYAINPKTGKPTAYGHEKVSAALVNRYSGFIEEMGGSPNIVEYIVGNHMKMKPHTWDVMRQTKKDKITDDPSFGDLEGLSKVDRGGLDLDENLNDEELGDVGVIGADDIINFSKHMVPGGIGIDLVRDIHKEFPLKYSDVTILYYSDRKARLQIIDEPRLGELVEGSIFWLEGVYGLDATIIKVIERRPLLVFMRDVTPKINKREIIKKLEKIVLNILASKSKHDKHNYVEKYGEKWEEFWSLLPFEGNGNSEMFAQFLYDMYLDDIEKNNYENQLPNDDYKGHIEKNWPGDRRRFKYVDIMDKDDLALFLNRTDRFWKDKNIGLQPDTDYYRKQFLSENIKDTIKHEEDEIERVVQDLNRYHDFKLSVKDVKKAFKKAELQPLTEEVWSQLQNTESNQFELGDMNGVKDMAKRYNKSNPMKLARKFISDDYRHPMIVSFDGEYRLVAGNTRLSTAKAIGFRPNVYIADLNKNFPISESIRKVVRGYINESAPSFYSQHKTKIDVYVIREMEGYIERNFLVGNTKTIKMIIDLDELKNKIKNVLSSHIPKFVEAMLLCDKAKTKELVSDIIDSIMNVFKESFNDLGWLKRTAVKSFMAVADKKQIEGSKKMMLKEIFYLVNKLSMDISKYVLHNKLIPGEIETKNPEDGTPLSEPRQTYKGWHCSRVPRKELESFISSKVDAKTKEVLGLISESDRKVIKEYGYRYQADFDNAYTDFNDQKLIPVIIKYLDKIIQFDGNILPGDLPEDWRAYFHNEPFEEHLCYGCNGVYTYSTSGDINREQDSTDNDDTVSAIAIAVTELLGGEWIEYYEIVHKYLLDRMKKEMKEKNYPDIHDMEW